ncbi:4-(cytidine 5'-diphospho)-2-C-methyl-D-erythritol kinase [Anaerofustis butyriciformans]|uniref:4-(cytidine 5'-diphospho)-2-C-methyl-D-erythritol kinase n=1 Tax=Anaerofustis butyriciformans TaxID=3108533 RepID=UPI003F892993
MNKIQIKIPAKVNLGLDIVGKREDNYHNIKTVMHSINIYDYLTFEKSDKIVITCNNTEVPKDESNIVYKCIKEISKLNKENKLLSVHIEKKIPVCAGLGGGSANGAAALIAYNKIYELNLSRDELCSIGEKIGADIPFLIHSGAGMCEGIGEKIRPIYPYIPCYVVLCKPDFGVSTKFAYDLIDNATDLIRPDFTALMTGLLEADKKRLEKGLINVFEPFVLEKYPEIKYIKDKFKKLDAIGVQMSGSGPSVFALYDSLSKAQRAYEEFIKEYDTVFLTNFTESENALLTYELR